MRKLPPGQDVIAQPDLSRWERGPLPISELEQAALEIFALKFAMSDWADPKMSVERNACRKLAVKLRVSFLALDRWTLENADEKLADEMGHLMFGERRLGTTIRDEVQEYCACFMADAWQHFRTRLFHAKDVDANQAELDAEDAIHGR